MKISLSNVGKRFNREWIFRHFNYTFSDSGTYAITGINGSGKSTLLQVIAGATLQSEGKLEYFAGNTSSDAAKNLEAPYPYISIAAPYLELIEEMTALEFLDFHSKFKKLLLEPKEILTKVELHKSANKQIRYYSSGMKQRLKLGQAFFSTSEVILLDEPSTNLDYEGIRLYHELVQDFRNDRMLILSSNDPSEYEFCKDIISIAAFK